MKTSAMISLKRFAVVATLVIAAALLLHLDSNGRPPENAFVVAPESAPIVAPETEEPKSDFVVAPEKVEKVEPKSGSVDAPETISEPKSTSRGASVSVEGPTSEPREVAYPRTRTAPTTKKPRKRWKAPNSNFKKITAKGGGGNWPPVLKLSEGWMLRTIRYSKFEPEDREFLMDHTVVLRQRAETVSKVCQKRKSELETHRKLHFIWDQTHKPSIVWCPIYKVASTTWLTNFLRLAHFNQNNTDIPTDITREEQQELRLSIQFGATHKAAFAQYPPPKKNSEKLRVLKESLRMIIVRHPFTRLLSAYRDKIAKEMPMPVRYGFRELRKAIIAKYRSPDSDDRSTVPTFAEFVQHVIDSTENLHTASDWQENVNCWVPYWTLCSVCSVDYNVIMKLETIQDDERFLVTVAGLEELKEKDTWKHLRVNSSTELKDEFFSQLTRTQVKLLHRRYEPDFELFGYDIKDYLAVAKD